MIKEEPSNNNNKDVLEMDSNHVSMTIENNLSDAAFSDDEEDEIPIRMYNAHLFKPKNSYFFYFFFWV